MTVQSAHSNAGPTPHEGAETKLADICTPGAYVCEETGGLLRVSEKDVARGNLPSPVGATGEALCATKICDDPYITLTRARMVASNLDLEVTF